MSETNFVAPFSLNCLELQAYQPNRYPFLMIDHVDEVLPGKYARGYKNLTLNEWYFPVHWPDGPNMPGVLQVEAVAQMLTVSITTLPGLKGNVPAVHQYKARFKKEVLPGNKFVIETEVLSWSRGICKGRGVATVDGEVACEADMLITFPKILQQFLPASNKTK